jgi:hypothetical protein
MTSQYDPFASANTSSSASQNGSTAASNATAGGNKNNNNNNSNPFDVFGFTSSSNQNNNGVAATIAAGGGGGGMASITQQQHPTLNNSATSAANNSSSAVSLTSSNASKNNININNNNNATRYKRVLPYNGPIADLQSNWDPWLYSAYQNNNGDNTNVNMTYLIVKTNSSCIVRGGVETVLKWMKVNRHNTNNATGGARMMDDLSMNLESSMSLEESFDYDSTTIINNNNSMNNDIATANSTGGNKKFGKLFKSGLKKAQASISHSVTNLAIKADGGKNPDLICASLHYLGGGSNGEVAHQRMMDAIGGGGGGGSGVNDVCLSKTDWIPLPSHTVNNDDGKEKEVSFAVPLCVPDLSFLESGGNNATQLTVRLYLRSGAKFLAAAIKKEYCIGECTLMYSQILGSNDGSESDVMGQYRTMDLSFTNGMLADPSTYSSSSNYSTESPPPTLHLVALPRIKFNPSCRLGWSLTDPTPMPPSSVAALRWLNMFQLPLDQAYSYPLLEGSTPAADGAAGERIILANECARESTVTLPIATACSKLLSDAAMQSQQRASMIAAKSRRRESVRSYAIPSDMDANRANAIVDMALKDGCMEVNMGVVAFVLLGDHQSSSIGGIHNLTSGAERVPSIRMSMTFQRVR